MVRPKLLEVHPIGVIHTPFTERVQAPRQAVLASDVPGRLELEPSSELEHALSDVDRWEYLWVLYWFDRNEGWRPKVLPPRSRTRRGVFSTRSPHRPNPIGMSAVRLERVEGLTLHVRGVDMLDGSPLLDVKPYVAYADALPGAGGGWLEEEAERLDPAPRYAVSWAPRAAEQAAWLREHHGVSLVEPVEATLGLGPQPHPYRRIRAHRTGMRLALKDWRIDFRWNDRHVVVEAIVSGYRPSQLAGEQAGLAPHRAFVERYGPEVPLSASRARG